MNKIALILEDSEQMKIIEAFEENIFEFNNEISAFKISRNVLLLFITQFNSVTQTHVKLDILDDADIINIIQT